MATIATVTEASSYSDRRIVDLENSRHYPPYAICEAAVWACRDLGTIPLVVYTLSGATALYLAKLRYHAPVFAFSPDIQVVRMLSLAWNITAFVLPFSSDIEQLHVDGEAMLLKKRLVRKGSPIGIISGTHAVRGATNTLRIRHAGE
jgi:pyruvate kinase